MLRLHPSLYAIGIGCALASVLASRVAAQPAQPQPASTDRIEASRHGCLAPWLCVLTFDDVKHLPDRNGSLGFKLVEGKQTFEMVDGKRRYQPFVMFAVFDIARAPSPSPRFKEGVSMITIGRFGFDSARTIERYVRSLSPGSQISLRLALPDRNGMAGSTEKIEMNVVDARSLRFKTTFPTFVTQEQAQRINR